MNRHMKSDLFFLFLCQLHESFVLIFEYLELQIIVLQTANLVLLLVDA